MRPATNDPQTTSGDGAARRCQTAGAPEDADDPRPEPHGDVEAPAPEEAGYGYGV